MERFLGGCSFTLNWFTNQKRITEDKSGSDRKCFSSCLSYLHRHREKVVEFHEGHCRVSHQSSIESSDSYPSPYHISLCHLESLANCLYVCVLSRFSHIWLFVTQQTIAHQTSLSMGFSRQECWSGLPVPSPGEFPNPGIKPHVFCVYCIGTWIL